MSPQFQALRTPAKQLVRVMGRACVAQTSGYPVERRSESMRSPFIAAYVALLGATARNTLY